MKTIGILNCSHIKNYGSVLQSYAMEKAVKRISGAEVISIRYQQRKGFRYLKNYLPQLFIKDIVTMKVKGLKRKWYLRFINKKLGNSIKTRESCFDKFIKENFNFSSTYRNWDELTACTKMYDAFILGSDQVWHPVNLGSHFYTMEWIPDEQPKIAYAASFGVSTIPHSQRNKTVKYLKRINEISVRETRGAEIIDELLGKKPVTVVDPTLLLEKEEWERLCLPIPVNEFIFCYFLGNNKKARQFAKELSEVTGLKILCIPFMDEINSVDMGFGDVQLFDVGPGEFVSYIRQAKYIVTDSFHGTVFSIIFKKKFIVFNRFQNKEKGSTNSRIDTLLNLLGLAERRVTSDVKMDPWNIMEQKINYEDINTKMDILKTKSLQYIIEAIKKYDLI